MDSSEYLGLFLDESRDSLRLLDASLLSLERDPGDAETLAAIFRAAHSLKGMSATVGMDAMAGLTHHMEDVLAALREARAPASRPVVDALFGCLDCLRALVDGAVAGIRLTPVEDVFLRFPRVVRDLAQTLEKLVDLRIDGGEVAIDRAVADHLGEPLVHALRNAIDHGLEDPAARVAAGKPAVGVLRLSARREGSSVLIEVRDDGRGMDPQVLRASAVRAGRMDVATALALPDADALRLVFLPGLSTARTITAISGGVGMDAVLAAVEALGGGVDITSIVGEGSAVTFRLPLAQPCPPS